MKLELHPDMLEATRLTRAGRLIEATELLQHLLRDEVAADTTTVPSGDTVTLRDASLAPLFKMPRTGPWTAPHPIDQNTLTAADGQTDTITQPYMPKMLHELIGAGTVQPHLPEALHSFLSQVDRIGSDAGFPEPYAPNLVPDGAQFVAGTYSNQAGNRTFKLFIPSGYRGEALPLVVMLHGCTQSPNDFAAGTRMNTLAEEHACFVVYPAQEVSANPSKCWNWFSPRDQRRGVGEPSLIAGITRQIMRDYAIDPQRVYVAGLSAGAAAAAIMGMTYPDLYAAVGVHSGLACGSASDLPSAFAAMRQGGPASLGANSSHAWGDGKTERIIPTIVFHGDQDSTVHPCNGDLVIAQSKATTTTDLHTTVENGQVAGGHAYSRTLHVDASGQAILEQWVVRGAGHAWSGGSPAGSFTDPRGPDATREMLRFFLDHPRPAAAQLA